MEYGRYVRLLPLKRQRPTRLWEWNKNKMVRDANVKLTKIFAILIYLTNSWANNNTKRSKKNSQTNMLFNELGKLELLNDKMVC